MYTPYLEHVLGNSENTDAFFSI